jgi:pSer/pThr/pTyr-binding forkhead associated (FHA) protein
VDHGSMNGTYLNNGILQYKETHELQIGDFIGFGID